MSSSTLNPPSTRSWRDIPQNVTPRAMGREGKKRMVMATGNIVGLILVLGAAGWGGFQLIKLWQTNPTRITSPTKGVPIRDFVVHTDGVLDKAWVVRTLALPKTASLMELNLGDMKQRLEESGQVSKAVLERKFPDVLIITLQERTPVARVVARMGDAAPVAFLVARDGMVYSGSRYNEAMAAGLPFLDGVKLIREGSGFERIDGMEAVADLLGTAQANTPAIYATFKIVSLARFADDRTLNVKTTEVESITFGAATDGFYKQLARLDYILEESRRQNAPGQLKAVNLAIGGNQVPVSFEVAAPTATTGRGASSAIANKSALRAGPANGTALFSFPPRNASPSQREF